MINVIIIIASVITALTTIITAAITIYKLVRNMEKRYEKINDNFEKINDNMKHTELSVLRLIVINDNMPLEERVNAGERYVNKGGNGSIHALYDVLRKQYQKQLKRK